MMGGAAVAGPTMAKNAIAQLPTGIGAADVMGAPIKTIGGYASIGTEARDYIGLSRLEQLRQALTGELTRDEKEELRRARLHASRAIIGHDIACLHSVSGAHKLRMHRVQDDKLMEDIRKSHIQSQIWWLEEDD